MKVHEIMTPAGCACSPATGLPEVARRMLAHDVQVVPVLDGDLVVGVITSRDIAIECIGQGHDAARCRARDHMVAPRFVVTPDCEVGLCARRMVEGRARRLPVVEGGRLRGFVALSDIPSPPAGSGFGNERGSAPRPPRARAGDARPT